ncbi:phosphatidylinositol-specific phospholipase C/glycerophosphodiester phosphodiesterase family protein [Maribacter halichondriae]|uniref:phosphatidylinositol-specific phospholipase C/glycerophosphodiester phosphodiesterase family protein n=1 Tax=Maribacter halichondriae TaxID=2980554 RepID=UPI0023590550|nr:phosphatidylinositol-specific phospholipase C/glycerophosphodiester phosphodiesterase family protein [Maribacter sp. Hal144]
MKKWLFFLVLIANNVVAQNSHDFRIHSHNDYLQNIPFWNAFSSGASSIEADVFLEDNELFVAHTIMEIDTLRNLRNLYLDPLQRSIDRNFIKDLPIQLLIDIKSEPYATLETIIRVLKDYPTITKNNDVSIVISGNRPKPTEYDNYPDFIHFDYQSLDEISDPSILEKIALVSLSFRKLSLWNGEGQLQLEDIDKISFVIKKANAMGKPFRFWATPDSETAWKTLSLLGIEFINTDDPIGCAKYLKTLKER